MGFKQGSLCLTPDLSTSPAVFLETSIGNSSGFMERRVSMAERALGLSPGGVTGIGTGRERQS